MTTGPAIGAATAFGPVAGDAVEQAIVRDMLTRAWPLPVAVVALGAFWGWAGLASAAFAVALATVNLVAAATLLSWTARISLGLLMGAALGGFILRLAVITGIVLAVHTQPWVSIVPLGLALVITHLGLLAWETRFVSASLAFPTTYPKPSRKG
ncbi:MAG: hypothetical protein NVSMB12_17800 [Acidimicrobiales bacterium]